MWERVAWYMRSPTTGEEEIEEKKRERWKKEGKRRKKEEKNKYRLTQLRPGSAWETDRDMELRLLGEK
jgi:hypothetical protein